MADGWNFLLLENVPSRDLPSFATSSKCPAFLSIKKNLLNSPPPPYLSKRSKLLETMSMVLSPLILVSWSWKRTRATFPWVWLANQSSPSVGRVQPRSFDFGFVRSLASSILQIGLRFRVYPPHANKRSSIQFREDEDALKDN